MDLTKIKLISGDFDRSFNKLKMILEGKFEEENASTEAISKLAEAVDRVDQEMKLLKNSLQSSESISQLKTRIQVALERKEPKILNENEIDEQLSTPLKNISTNNFEVEDFPSTPTLEQLGLSDPTLSIVGRRTGFDSSASISDGEFDNFYQKSPMVGGVDNSFSSDVSVPNFRIFNSSPATEPFKNSTAAVRSKSHNLKQVTTAANVLVDFSGEDSSILLDEEPQSKKVHFSEDVENKILNQ